jgi:aryl-alcohol dehydrogenase-like predicted oxidoreductase
MHNDTPPRATHFPTARRIMIGALATVASAGLISACGSSTSSSSSTATKAINLDTPHVAHAIEQSILGERHVHATVSCPAVIAQEEGKKFVCIATTRDGKGTKHKTPFAVTEQNGKGYVTYKAE